MESYTLETVRHFATASYLAGTLDEMRADGRRTAFDPWLVRTESAAIATCDGFMVDQMEFARAAAEKVATNVDKGVKSALDALRARRLVATWTSTPSTDALLDVHAISSRSTARRLDVDGELRLQSGAEEIARMLREAAEAADLREAARVLGSVVFEEAFAGNARRMRLLTASWLAARVLGLKRDGVPIAAPLAKQMNACGDFPSEWSAGFARAMEAAGRAAIDGLRNINLLADALRAESRIENKGSSIGDAIDFFIGHPVATASDLETPLKVTRRGANMIVDRMLGSGVIELAYPDRTKNRVFLCRRALSI